MHNKKLRGFTIIELLVVTAIISIMAAILFPVFVRAREKARQSACLDNLKQIGIAITQYAQEYDTIYPHAVNPLSRFDAATSAYSKKDIPSIPLYTDVLQPYLRSRQVFRCMSDTGRPPQQGSDLFPNNDFLTWGSSYRYNEFAETDSNDLSPAMMPLCEDAGYWHGPPQEYVLQGVFADNHVKQQSDGSIMTDWHYDGQGD